MSLKDYHDAVREYLGLNFDKDDYAGERSMTITIDYTDATPSVVKQAKGIAKDYNLQWKMNGNEIIIEARE